MEIPESIDVQKECNLRTTLFKPNGRKLGYGLLISFDRIVIVITVLCVWLNGYASGRELDVVLIHA